MTGAKTLHALKNLLSAIQNPEAVESDAIIEKEIAAQRLAGPFSSPPFSHFRISPLGLVPKKTEGEFRLIHHLSFPRGSSLNDGVSSEFTSVSYATVDDAICTIKTVGQGCFLAKTDIKNAFRIIPIRPQDYNLLGFFGDDYIIMTTVCRWVALALAKLLKCFILLSNGLPKRNCISITFCTCWMIFS